MVGGCIFQILLHGIDQFCRSGVHDIQLQFFNNAVCFGRIVLQDSDFNVVGVHLVADGAKQQPMCFGSAGKIMHTVFVHREKLQRFLFFQKADKMGFAVGLFTVMQHRLCENKEVFRSGAGNTQSKLRALQ